MTLMAMGKYYEPDGCYFPSIRVNCLGLDFFGCFRLFDLSLQGDKYQRSRLRWPELLARVR